MKQPALFTEESNEEWLNCRYCRASLGLLNTLTGEWLYNTDTPARANENGAPVYFCDENCKRRQLMGVTICAACHNLDLEQNPVLANNGRWYCSDECASDPNAKNPNRRKNAQSKKKRPPQLRQDARSRPRMTPDTSKIKAPH